MEPFEHAFEGRQDFVDLVRSQVKKVEGICIALAVTLVGGGVFTWWDKLQQWMQGLGYQGANSALAVLVFASLAVVIAVLVFLLICQKNKRLLDLRWHLHEFAHTLRDAVVEAEGPPGKTRKSSDQQEVSRNFRLFCNDVCDRGREFFRSLVNDDTITCCLRIADKDSDDPKDPNVSYCTAGRSKGLSASRDETSKPIPANLGIPCFLLREGSKGVLICHDIRKAIRDHAFVETENERRFPNEIKTLMVAPVNGWTDKGERMIGLFYVNSKRDRFRPEHVDSLRTIADMLGIAIPRVVNQLDKRQNRFSIGEKKR